MCLSTKLVLELSLPPQQYTYRPVSGSRGPKPSEKPEATLSLYTQMDTSKRGGGEEEDNWDTDTEMCDDLAWCLDYIELSNKWYLYNCI